MILLCKRSDVEENSARGFEVDGVKIIVAHKHGNFSVFENNCPHQSIPLEWMPDQFLDYDKNFIQCATHGALFKIDSGECVFGPCIGDHLTAIPFTLDDDALWLNKQS